MRKNNTVPMADYYSNKRPGPIATKKNGKKSIGSHSSSSVHQHSQYDGSSMAQSRIYEEEEESK